MRRRRVSVVLFFVATVASTASPVGACTSVSVLGIGQTCPPADDPKPQKATERARSDPDDALLTMLNRSRARAGLRPLAADARVASVARRHARRMAARGRIYHNPALGTPDGRRALGRAFVSENVGVSRSAARVHAAFMASPGHRANILDGAPTAVGIGVYEDGSAIWVVQVFVGGSKPRSPALEDEDAQPTQRALRLPVETITPGTPMPAAGGGSGPWPAIMLGVVAAASATWVSRALRG